MPGSLERSLLGSNEDASYDVNILDDQSSVLGTISVPANTAYYSEEVSIAVSGPMALFCQIVNTEIGGSLVRQPMVTAILEPS